jgi:DNA-binding CsgD family transcriptional regulator
MMKNLFSDTYTCRLLSPREELILNAAKNQLTEQEIANYLNISQKTVARHLLNITDKILDTDQNLAYQIKQKYKLKAHV